LADFFAVPWRSVRSWIYGIREEGWGEENSGGNSAFKRGKTSRGGDSLRDWGSTNWDTPAVDEG